MTIYLIFITYSPMINQEYILKSEVRKMIEKKIEEKDSFYVNHEYTD